MGLLGMATTDPAEALWAMAGWAVWVACCSDTQDICIDAYRIESAEDDLQAAMAAGYIFGYRFALLIAGAGALFIADSADWESAYNVMALAMLVGLCTTLLIKEPSHASQTIPHPIPTRSASPPSCICSPTRARRCSTHLQLQAQAQAQAQPKPNPNPNPKPKP